MDQRSPFPPHRVVRSFVTRDGRLTPSQQKALDELFPKWGLDPKLRDDRKQEPGDGLEWHFDWAEIFGRETAPVFEIGFGNGENLAEQAEKNPDKDYVGIEVYRVGVGRLLNQIEQRGLSNLRVICADAVEVLNHRVAPESLSALWLFFPDPWHKKRHHKRRIVQPAFADLVASKVTPSGIWHLATDWVPYAEHMLEVLEAHSAWENTAGPGQKVPPPDNRIETHFEKRGLRKGHEVADLVYKRL
ncbi:MAG: tRNA (guanosine(46)-N7)-methyltransferase TrmB [Gammaproteobacteria bacterium]|nr:tRNA (guanosine(46)-N7)-methyltransferase TrmB [Gammaproteobacteria bacterium]